MSVLRLDVDAMNLTKEVLQAVSKKTDKRQSVSEVWRKKTLQSNKSKSKIDLNVSMKFDGAILACILAYVDRRRRI